MVQNHIHEEKIVDYILGNLSSETATEVENHLKACSHCKAESESWQHLLDKANSPIPSPALKARLNENIERLPKQRKDRWKRPVIAVASAAVLFLFVGLYLFNGKEQMDTVSQDYIMAQHDEIPENILVERSDTNHLEILPVATNESIRGDIWMNEATNEMMIRVDGLTPLNAQDYQLWLVRKNDLWNGELLHLQNGSVRVYYKGPDIRLVKHIKVSVEPLGGSLTPTGPEKLRIDLPGVQ